MAWLDEVEKIVQSCHLHGSSNTSKLYVPWSELSSSIVGAVLDASLIAVIAHQADHTRHAYHGLVAISRDCGSWYTICRCLCVTSHCRNAACVAQHTCRVASFKTLSFEHHFKYLKSILALAICLSALKSDFCTDIFTIDRKSVV